MNHLTEFFLFVVVVLVTQAFFPVFLCSNFIKTIKHQAKNGYGRMFFEQKNQFRSSNNGGPNFLKRFLGNG